MGARKGWWKVMVGSMLLAVVGAGMAWPVRAGAARAPARVVVRGTLAQVDAKAKRLVVMTAKGERVPVTGTDRTVLLVVGISKPTWEDLHPDARVLVVGVRKDGEVEATRIGVRPPVLSVRGTVAAISDNGLTLNTKKGMVRLVADHRTRFRVPGVKTPSLKDFKVGDEVSVLAVGHFDDTWYATRVRLVRRAR